jgi:hypothetical protein
VSRYICPFGHLENGRPIVHPSKQRCSEYVRLRAEGKIDKEGRVLTPASKEPTVSAPEAPAAGAPIVPGAKAGPSPTDVTKPLPFWKRIGSGTVIRYRQVSTTPPPQPGEANSPEPGSWLVSADTSERFWTVIFAFIKTVIDMLTTFLQIPNVPEEVFTLDPGQAFLFRTSLRGYTTKILVNTFGAHTPEEADDVVNGLGGLLAFGGMGLKIAIHFVVNLPKSPRLATLRARAAANKAKREEARALKREEEERRRLAGGAGGATRPAGAPA